MIPASSAGSSKMNSETSRKRQSSYMERHRETIMELMAEQKPLEILIKEAVAKM